MVTAMGMKRGLARMVCIVFNAETQRRRENRF